MHLNHRLRPTREHREPRRLSNRRDRPWLFSCCSGLMVREQSTLERTPLWSLLSLLLAMIVPDSTRECSNTTPNPWNRGVEGVTQSTISVCTPLTSGHTFRWLDKFCIIMWNLEIGGVTHLTIRTLLKSLGMKRKYKLKTHIRGYVDNLALVTFFIVTFLLEIIIIIIFFATSYF